MANSTSHTLPYPIKNARFTLEMSFRVAAGTPTDPTTPDTEFSTDGGATFADCAEEITTGGSNGIGYLTLTGAETNANILAIAGKSANCVTTPVTLYPRVLASVGTGTLSAGAAGGGTLGTLLAYDVTGCYIQTTGGTGGGGTGGANNQARKIVTYNTSSGVFTVTPNWETTPDATTTYSVLLPEGVTLGMLKTLNPTTAGRTLDVSTGGEAGLDWANVGSPTTTLALTGTTIATTQKVDVETIKTQSVTCAAGVTVLASVGTAATSTAQTGDTFVRIGAAGAGLTAIGDTRMANLDALISSRMATYVQPTGFLAATFPATVASTTNITAGTIATVSGNVNGNVQGDLSGKVLGGGFSTITGDGVKAASVTGNVGGNVVGTVGSVTGAVGSVAAAVTVGGYSSGQDPATLVLDVAASGHNSTGSVGAKINSAASAGDPWATVIPGSYVSGTAGNILGNKLGFKLASDGLDSVVVETGINARQALAMIGAATAGKASGLDTSTAVFYAMGTSGTSTPRITATTDSSGNRTATTLSLPA